MDEKIIEKTTSYVCEIDQQRIPLLEKYLAEKGWKMEPFPPHARWKAVKDKINIVAYNSGKLTVQGRGTGEFVTYFLEPEILGEARLGYENILDGKADKVEREEEFTPHAGVDESGKGDFFGPLVIAAVYVDDDSRGRLLKIGVKDSKKIKNDRKIALLAVQIRKIVGGKFAVISIGLESYNRLYLKIGNLNRLLAWGHARAIENLLDREPACKWALSDKFANEKLILNALMEKGRKIEIRQRTKAESDIAVAAASILARDEFVRKIAELGKDLGIHLPKGAGSIVDEAAARIVEKLGRDRLASVAKMHFKTASKALGLPPQPEPGKDVLL
ncbi:MAG TPA: ribonuclease HIII [Lentisphaeria bacterium]|nr:MAG: ribonuclease HIII [Lentisphaerae bacterium GWF2_50_93]HCE42515.1 ribonuclease HIII [Lentisphaeria bacterium]